MQHGTDHWMGNHPFRQPGLNGCDPFKHPFDETRVIAQSRAKEGKAHQLPCPGKDLSDICRRANPLGQQSLHFVREQ